MDTKTLIDSCMDQLKKMLGEANNELSSKQRSKLEKYGRDLKQLRRAKRFTHRQLSDVVEQIAAVVVEMIDTDSSE